jgi:predicted YcjX-like family ATPase
MIEKGWCSDEIHIQKMIANGFDDFKTNVVKRIFKEHRYELDLNLCP